MDISRREQRNVVYGYSDMLVIENGGVNSSLIYASIIVSEEDAATISNNYKMFNPMGLGEVYGRERGFCKRDTDMSMYKGRDSLTHIIFKKKLSVREEDGYIHVPIFLKNKQDCYNIFGAFNRLDIPKEIVDATYNAIVDNSSMPVLEDWKEYITYSLIKNKSYEWAQILKSNSSFGADIDYGFKSVAILYVSKSTIINIITNGLKKHEINIDGCSSMSPEVENIKGLDDYQNMFGQTLAEQITRSFRPKFNPATEELDQKINDFYSVCQFYTPDIEDLNVQKNVIQGTINNLDKNRNTLISGQTGAGKTIMAIGSVCCHAKKPNFNVIVMCPSGLTERWKEGIEKTVPFSIVRIVTNLKEFFEIKQEIDNPIRMRSLWVIISDNTAKINYETRPAVIYDKFRECYICPHCGRKLAYKRNRDRYGHLIRGGGSTYTSGDELTFNTFDDDNATCKLVFEKNSNLPVTGCGQKLWTAATRENSKHWIKLNRVGWIPKDRIKNLKENLEYYLPRMDANAPKTMIQKYHTILKSLTEYETRGSVERYPNRYNISRYIKKHMKNSFDYGIFDEVHLLQGDSLQGDAFGNICNSVWKSIFLTGTMSNGYASGLFYMLFRTQTSKMLDDGFKYDSIKSFSDKYGVKENSKTYTGRYQRVRGVEQFVVDNNSRPKTTKNRDLPGISPTLFADYLLDNTVFVSKRDIKKNLCKYSEIPIGVPMDNELRLAYNRILQNVSNNINRYNVSRRDMRDYIFSASMFLDQPYGMDIRDTDNQIIELCPDTVRNKERELVRIISEKKNAGEKCLIYCEWTQKLEIVNKLVEILKKHDIKAVGIDNSVKLTERQKWLEEQARDGIDAVVLNPALVGTGLNLLDYTTIVFYEIGAKVISIRQASQRSNRINQTHPVEVYFLYYKDSIQEDMLGAISMKMKAATAIEGDFSESALKNMTDDTDILTKLADSISKNEKIVIDESNFEKTEDETENNETETAVSKFNTHFSDRSVFDFNKPKRIMNVSKIA